MCYLPKWFYFFRVLTVLVPSHILHIHQRKLLQYIWGSTRSWISKQMYVQRINGGLSVPNLQDYYTTANIASLFHLHETYQLPLWATIDLVDSDPTPVSSIPWLPPIHRPTTIGPCLAHFLWLWDSVQCSAGLISPYFPLLHLLHCTLFLPGCENLAQFSWWTANGFTDSHFCLFLPGFWHLMPYVLLIISL